MDNLKVEINENNKVKLSLKLLSYVNLTQNLKI